MTKSEKLLSKLANASKTFNWKDLVTIMGRLGYEMHEREGSRILFRKPETNHMIKIHKPHPENIIKGGALKDVKRALKSEGYL